MRLPDEPEPPLQINIVPMIDVVFAVLTFFIFASLHLTEANGLPVNLPTAITGERQDQRQVDLTMTAQGDLFLGDQPLTRDQLPDSLRTLIPAGETGLVVIRADAQVPHGQVVAVMDVLRRLQGVQIAIATQPSS